MRMNYKPGWYWVTDPRWVKPEIAHFGHNKVWAIRGAEQPGYQPTVLSGRLEPPEATC